MIRFLIDTTIKNRDVHGNCYNFSIVTSTKTNQTLYIDSGYGSDGGNIQALLRKAGLDWSEIHYSGRVEKARRYEQLKSSIDRHNTFLHEHEVTNEMFFNLEKVESTKI